MKTGANKRDQIQIRKMKKDGVSIEEISATLMITKKVVAAFANPKVEEKKETK